MTFTGKPQKQKDDRTHGQELRFAVVAFVLLCVVGICWATRSAPEPSYKGKLLSAWMEDLYGEVNLRLAKEPLQYEQAREAIHALGDEALPMIIKRMGAPNQTQVDRLFQAAIYGPRTGYLGTPLSELRKSPSFQRELATHAFGALGTAAIKAIPDVIALLSRREPEIRSCAIRALSSLQTNAISVVPALDLCLTNDPDASVRVDAAIALAKIHPIPAQLVPVLAVGLGDASPLRRSQSALALGSLGTDAQTAVPTLTALLADPEPSVAQATRQALTDIKR